jgi:hypothetical protein
MDFWGIERAYRLIIRVAAVSVGECGKEQRHYRRNTPNERVKDRGDRLRRDVIILDVRHRIICPSGWVTVANLDWI